MLTLPAKITDIQAPVLDIYMAETLVIINLDESSVDKLIDAARQLSATRFTGPKGRPLSVIPTNDERALPTLHPDHGWLLPLSPPVVKELLESGLSIGDNELDSINVAFIVHSH